MEEMKGLTPSDTKASLRKAYAYKTKTNEHIRNADAKNKVRNRGFYQSLGNTAVHTQEDFLERLAQPTRRKKSKGRVAVEGIVKRSGKPYCSEWGMTNPLKLNLSSSTLSSIRK